MSLINLNTVPEFREVFSDYNQKECTDKLATFDVARVCLAIVHASKMHCDIAEVENWREGDLNNVM